MGTELRLVVRIGLFTLFRGAVRFTLFLRNAIFRGVADLWLQRATSSFCNSVETKWATTSGEVVWWLSERRFTVFFWIMAENFFDQPRSNLHSLREIIGCGSPVINIALLKWRRFMIKCTRAVMWSFLPSVGNDSLQVQLIHECLPSISHDCL